MNEILQDWIGHDIYDRISLGLAYLSALIILNLFYWGVPWFQ